MLARLLTLEIEQPKMCKQVCLDEVLRIGPGCGLGPGPGPGPSSGFLLRAIDVGVVLALLSTALNAQHLATLSMRGF